jgi:hypothetical protein
MSIFKCPGAFVKGFLEKHLNAIAHRALCVSLCESKRIARTTRASLSKNYLIYQNDALEMRR